MDAIGLEIRGGNTHRMGNVQQNMLYSWGKINPNDINHGQYIILST